MKLREMELYDQFMSAIELGSCISIALFLFIVWTPKFRLVTRDAVHQWATKHVENGMYWVLFAQQFKTAWLTRLFVQSSRTVSVGFYGTVLPLLAWTGLPELAMNLVILMAFTLYIGNASKDLIASPRPIASTKGIKKLAFLGSGSEETTLNAKEYGLPSSHTMNSLCLNFYIIHYLRKQNLISDSLCLACYGAAFLWVVWIAASRIYLGFHTPIDIFTGIVMGLVVLQAFMGVEDTFEFLPRIPLFYFVPSMLLISGYCLRMHPLPPTPTPSFEFSTSFMGVMVGVMTGAVSNESFLVSKTNPAIFLTFEGFLWYFIKIFWGFAIMLFVKSVCKSMAELVFSIVFDLFPLSFRRLLQPPMHNVCPPDNIRNPKVKSLPHSSQGFPLDVDVVVRFVSYAGVGFAAFNLAPRAFAIIHQSSFEIL